MKINILQLFVIFWSWIQPNNAHAHRPPKADRL
jgi:hypothetical protein